MRSNPVLAYNRLAAVLVLTVTSMAVSAPNPCRRPSPAHITACPNPCPCYSGRVSI